MATGLRLVTERVGDGAGQPVLDAAHGEELVHVEPSVSVVLGNRPAESPGTLYISTKQVVWLSDADRGKGYAVDFLSINLHAVSRDPEAYSSPCIYTQIETGDEDDESEGSDSEILEAVDLSKITEMRLVPSNPDQLETLFNIFCECAELNPEPVEEEEEGEHNWVFSADNLEREGAVGGESDWISQDPIRPIGSSNGDHDLANTVLQSDTVQRNPQLQANILSSLQLQINDHRFEDAEEMDKE